MNHSIAELDKSYQYCREVACINTNFYMGMLLTERHKRNAIYVIYAWLRKADDLGDDESFSQQRRLVHLKYFYAKTNVVLSRSKHLSFPPHGELWTAVSDAFLKYKIPKEKLRDQINGQIIDLKKHDYENFEELYTYCKLVSSSVGALLLKVWRYRNNLHNIQTEREAEYCGVALQLTNILRDMKEDMAADKIYLPTKSLGKKNKDCKALGEQESLSELIEMTRQYYIKSKDLYKHVNLDGKLSFLVIYLTYQKLFNKITRYPKAIYKHKIKLNRLDKFLILTKAMYYYAFR